MGASSRKRKSHELEGDNAAGAEDIQAALRRHFESQFMPLEPAVADLLIRPEQDDDASLSDEESGDSGWGGISENEDEVDAIIKVVDHSATATATSAMTRREVRKFLSSRPPDISSHDSATKTTAHPAANGDLEGDDTPALLANDLALQRLISESHLLSQSTSLPSQSQLLTSSKPTIPSAKVTSQASQLFATGRLRQAQTAHRLRTLGSTAHPSVQAQARMPHVIRKGIAAAARERESKRRSEARENGVVLERQVSKTAGRGKGGGDFRRRGVGGVDMPGVGKMRGAELKISKREAMSIQGLPDRGKGYGTMGRGHRRRR